jgi:IPT/TIG domain-containing protein
MDRVRRERFDRRGPTLVSGRTTGVTRALAVVGALAFVVLAVVTASASATECYSGSPACANYGRFQPLVFGGQTVMPTTTTYFVYWDPKGAPAFPAGYESGITTYFKGLEHDDGTDQNFYSVLTQYYGPSDTAADHVKYETHFGKALTDKDAYPAETEECANRVTSPCIGQVQIEGELGHLIKAKKLPAEFKPGGYAYGGEQPRTTYFVLLPPGVSTCESRLEGGGPNGCSQSVLCSYHTSSILGLNHGESESRKEELLSPSYEGPETFAIVPYNVGNACDGGQHPNGISDGALDSGMVHEFAEMITDPYGDSWLNTNPQGQEEDADICSFGYWAFGNEAFAKKMFYGTPLGTAPNGALYNQVVDGRDYYYQQMWSNETGGCVQRKGLPPTVTKLAPARGSVAGGKKVKITGLNFENPTVTSVSFGKLPAKEFTVISPTSMTAVSPASTSTGVVEVKLTTSAGTNASTTSDQFTYEAK